MTREQAKREIDSLDYYLQNHTDDYSEESHTAMMMAIKALEQEPCEDAISRQAVLDVIEREQFKGDAISEIEKLPPVNPQEPIGHWIDADGDNAICGCCNRLNHLYGTYCKHCGARMTEVADD